MLTDDSVKTIRNLLEGADDSPVRDRLTRELELLELAEPKGTMRGWMQARSGIPIDMIQATDSGGWAPLARTLNSSHSTYATFDGSRREYVGMHVVAATDTALLVTTTRDIPAVIMYVETKD